MPKVRLQRAFSATAINVIRLDSDWAGTPVHPRTSRLERLACQLTA
ncbi:hypothetical protein [Streptomyces cathayae]|uniref:Transposase n=1 Tax=Streptomyces cathayae TaxID=3031124 RepID=A0ABY8JXW3_9ACTN|nr:hypothetical protein [Streptomyces sp. HUAS 5]WGD40079.1 hypothetical protein PYS65_08000 [Streptomyces sp. HUAS 5]